MTNKNPELKCKQRIRLVRSSNGLQQYEGKMCTVKTVGNSKTSANILIDGMTGTFGLYQSNDTWVLASRKDMAEYLEEKNDELKKEVYVNEKEITLLRKYESEEEEFADKIAQLLKNPTKESIQKVLKTMKKSDYL